MGCAQTKQQGTTAGAPEPKTLLSRRRDLAEDVAAFKTESGFSKLDSSHEEVLPKMIYPLPPTAAGLRQDEVIAIQRSMGASYNSLTSRSVEELRMLEDLQLLPMHHKPLEPGRQFKMQHEWPIYGTVLEKRSDTDHLRSSFVSEQTASFGTSGPTDSCRSMPSCRSSNSVSSAFTFAPPMQSAYSNKLAAVTEEDVEGGKDDDHPHVRPEVVIPEAPVMAVALENALHSVVDAGENLCNLALATWPSADCRKVTISLEDDDGRDERDSNALLSKNPPQWGLCQCI